MANLEVTQAAADSLVTVQQIGLLGLEAVTWQKLLLSLVVLVTASLIDRFVFRWFTRSIDDRRLQYQWRKGLSYAIAALSLLIIATVWIEGLRQIGTFLGLLSAGLAIALHDIVADLAGWLYIVWKGPFRLGDRIQIGEHSGDVVDISMMQFSMIEIGNWVDADQSTGRIIHVPNAQVLSHPVANFMSEFPFVWHEIPVLVTFESDWRRAKEILVRLVAEASADVELHAEEALRKSTGRMLISYQNVAGTVYTSVRDDGVLLTLRMLVEPRRRRGTEQTIWEKILDAFDAEENIGFAYRTHRIFREDADYEREAAHAARGNAAQEP